MSLLAVGVPLLAAALSKIGMEYACKQAIWENSVRVLLFYTRTEYEYKELDRKIVHASSFYTSRPQCRTSACWPRACLCSP